MRPPLVPGSPVRHLSTRDGQPFESHGGGAQVVAAEHRLLRVARGAERLEDVSAHGSAFDGFAHALLVEVADADLAAEVAPTRLRGEPREVANQQDPLA